MSGIALRPARDFDLARHNASVFMTERVSRYYATEPLQTAEAVGFIRHAEAIVGRRVLDLGVGTGRTTRVLLPLADGYVGLDLARPMLEIARRLFPGTDFIEADMRTVGRLGLGRFDAVVASCNLLDALGHDDRLAMIAAIRELLPTGGVFFLSAHNRDHVDAGRPPVVVRSANPLRTAKRVLVHLRALRNRARLIAHEVETADHAILTDCAHDWQGLYYYIDRRAQERQVAGLGFEVIDVIAENGRSLTPGETDTSSGSLHYVCRAV